MSWNDDYGRVQAMTSPSLTWDLSPNDIKALESVLSAFHLVVDEIACRDGQTSDQVIERIAKECDKFSQGGKE
jgi:hypothetical protein